ncbi:hypothetical protein FS749_015840 [Ceratobasidium sp. UAMH 11750]|nr:hypothetical protein FS749_015840 [Ceratobasidium sp. UAMH 11750]
MHEILDGATPTPGSFFGDASRSEPYRGTPLMQIPAADDRRNQHVGISLGVDVGHLAPKSDAVNTSYINAGSSDGHSGAKDRPGGKLAAAIHSKQIEDGQAGLPRRVDGSKRVAQAAAAPLPDGRQLPARPLLDEAISWDRIAGASKSAGKRRWWHMP